MKSSKVYEMLDGLARGTEMDYAKLPELMAQGLVKPVTATGEPTAELDELKTELKKVKHNLKELRERGIDLLSGPHMERQKERERELRHRILETVQNLRLPGVVKTRQGDLTLTYKGREALQLLEVRMPVAGDWPWKVLFANLDSLNRQLAREAVEASRILKRISPRLKDIDEYLLRSAAVGLASIEGEPELKARRFIEHARALSSSITSEDTFVVLGAEEAVTLEQQGRMQEGDLVDETRGLLSQLEGYRSPSSRRTVATLLMSRPHKERSGLLSRIKAEFDLTGSLLGAALLQLEATDIETSRARFHHWMTKLKDGFKGDRYDIVVASALLATTTTDNVDIEVKFDRVSAGMRGLFKEKMLTASAIISLWPTKVEESFDNVRLAASQVLLKKLSVGGVENFSLGIKLLANNAVFINTRMGSLMGSMGDDEQTRKARESGALDDAATSGVALLASPLLMRSPFTVFHAITLQMNAAQDFRFHPVHTSYLYG